MFEKNKVKKTDQYKQFLQEMHSYRKKGVAITLEGEDLPLKKIADACIAEGRESYMGDFVMDDHGKLREIRFDRVSDR